MNTRIVVLVTAALLGSSAARAQTVEIEVRPCPGETRLVVREAPLSVVLKKLAGALKFDLRYEASTDPIVSMTRSAPPAQLLKNLAPDENVLVVEARDPGCALRSRVVRVAVLPAGTASSRPRPAPSAVTAPEPSAAERGHGSAAVRGRLGIQ